MAPSNPVIVLPGITANYLDDLYPLPPESIWRVLEGSKDFERAALHPDNLAYEAVEPARVRPGQIYEIVYRELVEELRFNLTEREDKPVPVYPFGYDWRQPIEIAAEALGDMIDETIERTLLMRHYGNTAYAEEPKVDLVGHSMGGLVIATYLRKVGSAKIGKVVSLATPFRGSFEPFLKIMTGTADLGASAPSSREREAARLVPALYQLLADMPGSITFTHDGKRANPFDPTNWQPSVVATIKEFIRRHGLKPSNRAEQAQELFSALLAGGKRFRTLINGFSLTDAGLTSDDWLCIAGANTDTRVRLRIRKSGTSASFVFRSEDRANEWKETDPRLADQTGDGTVPLASAMPAFLPREKVVCVIPKDFGYWEDFQDRTIMRWAGFHGMMPTMNLVHRLIVRFLRNQRPQHGNTWGHPPPGVSEARWDPPFKGGLRVRS